MKGRSKWITMAAGAGVLFGMRSMVRWNRRFDLNGRCVLITGGSRGLGLVLAREALKRGAFPILFARDQEDLEAARRDLDSMAERNAVVMQCDVSRREEVEKAIEEAARIHGRIDVLINNAGIIQIAPLQHMTIEDFEQAMAIHFWGPLFTTLAVLPWMRRRGEGRIVNISSIGGKVSVPHLVPYSASKFALVGLSDGLRAELAQYGIRVTTVCPGLMRTGSHVNTTIKGRHREEFSWFAVSAGMPGISMNAERAARKIISACIHGRPVLDLGWPAKTLILADAITPSLVAEGMAIANRFLPKATGGPTAPRSGWESQSNWAPSWLTRLADNAIEKNNELRGHSPEQIYTAESGVKRPKA